MTELSAWPSEQPQTPYVLKTPKDSWGTTWEPSDEEKDNNTRETSNKIKGLESLKNEERVEQILVEGDPKIGTIYILAQAHIPSNFATQQPETMKLIARYQYQIAREILAKGLQNIWSESLSLKNAEKFRFIQDYALSWLLDENPGLLEFSANELPKEPSETALRVIEKFQDGDLTVALSHPKITLHGGQADNKRGTLSKMCGTIPELLNLLGISTTCSKVLTIRERWIVERLHEYLQKKPGERIGVVYGFAHEFSDDISLVFGDRVPRVVEVMFPKLVQDISVTSSRELSGQIGKDEENPHMR